MKWHAKILLQMIFLLIMKKNFQKLLKVLILNKKSIILAVEQLVNLKSYINQVKEFSQILLFKFNQKEIKS